MFFKVPPSPVPSTPKPGNYAQYHEVLDAHKQKIADGERRMDANQGHKPTPHIQVYQRPAPGHQNLRPTPNVGRPALLRNDYLENRRQAQLNKARGQGYGPVCRFYMFNFVFDSA